mgnify:CR=1 FL=1
MANVKKKTVTRCEVGGLFTKFAPRRKHEAESIPLKKEKSSRCRKWKISIFQLI